MFLWRNKKTLDTPPYHLFIYLFIYLLYHNILPWSVEQSAFKLTTLYIVEEKNFISM